MYSEEVEGHSFSVAGYKHNWKTKSNTPLIFGW
jgi:hypothetical protein